MLHHCYVVQHSSGVTAVLGARRRNSELRSPHLSVALGQKVKRYAIEQLMSEQVVYETTKSLLPAATFGPFSKLCHAHFRVY